MSELFENDEEKESITEDEFIDDVDVDVSDIDEIDIEKPSIDARRRLENLLEEKRLRDELEDFLDY
ncbi:MAG: PA3496 family putative envelope integrity protein [Legionella sp.]